MANSAEPDQLASSEVHWSGSTLFAKAGYIQVQQDYRVKKFKPKFLTNANPNIDATTDIVCKCCGDCYSSTCTFVQVS